MDFQFRRRTLSGVVLVAMLLASCENKTPPAPPASPAPNPRAVYEQTNLRLECHGTETSVMLENEEMRFSKTTEISSRTYKFDDKVLASPSRPIGCPKWDAESIACKEIVEDSTDNYSWRRSVLVDRLTGRMSDSTFVRQLLWEHELTTRVDFEATCRKLDASKF